MNRLTEQLQRLFVSLAHVLALETVLYVQIVGFKQFDTLTAEQVSFLQSLLTGIAPFLALKVADFINTLRGNK